MYHQPMLSTARLPEKWQPLPATSPKVNHFNKAQIITQTLTEPFEDTSFIPNPDTIACYQLTCLAVECSKQVFLER